MREVISIGKEQVVPTLAAVLRTQGIPDRSLASERVTQLAEMALIVYRELTAPAGIMMEVDQDEFSAVYQGLGLNEESTPLDLIVPAAEQLALFAVTLGNAVSERIALLFDEQEFALGVLLDGTASAGAEIACNMLRTEYHSHLDQQEKLDSSFGVLPFSPGYCGWHISAQQKLFKTLEPGAIGISLSETFLMEPLKSVSGVFVVAPKAAFDFDDDFPFCTTCQTRTCRDRITDVMVQ
jgi:hypothetical protein